MTNAYATTAQLEQFGLDSTVTATLAAGLAQAHLDAAASWLDGRIAARYPDASLPLSSVTLEVTQCVCERAAFSLLRFKKFDAPDEGNSYKTQSKMLDAWADKIAAGLVSLIGSSPAATVQPRLTTRTPLGWHDTSEDDE